MQEKIWKNQQDKGCHIVLNTDEFIAFQQWMNAEKKPVVVQKNHQKAVIKELIGVLLPHVPPNDPVFQQEEEVWNNRITEGYGRWIYYTWHQTATWLPEEKEFFKIRTSRNKHLITEEEQARLQNSKIGIVGLSVGHSIASALAMECCGGELRLADFDRLDLSNLNRIRSSLLQLGQPKTTIAYQTIAELNPFLNISLWEEGLNESNINSFLSGLDLVVEECDSLDIKVLTRERAKEMKIPVIMETADRGMIDIERFDLEPNRPILHGLAGAISVAKLKGLTTEEKVPFVLPLVGGEQLSVRMKASMLEINKSIKSWPQLGAQVQMGSGLCADLVRKMLLNQIQASGRYYFDVEKMFDAEEKTWYIQHESIPANHDFISLETCQSHAKQRKDCANQTPLPHEEIVESWIKAACLAPTGGNMQHWWWIKEGQTIYLYEDQQRSNSFLNFNQSGSCIGFGAALENLTLAAHQDGFELAIHLFPDELFLSCVAAISVKQIITIKDPRQLQLFEAIKIRCTDRRAGGNPIGELADYSQQLNVLIDHPEFKLQLIDQSELIDQTAFEVGLADRLRFLNPQAHADFLAEMRWTPEENERKRDGIDLASCYLKPSELAVLSIAKDRRAFDFLEQQQLGHGLGELTSKLVRTTPALGLLIGTEDDSIAYIKAGKLIERIWLRINGDGYSFQPVSPITFLYLRNRYSPIGLLPWQRKLLTESEKRMKACWDLQKEEVPLFLFRLFSTEEMPVRSLRRPVEEVYIKSASK